jgi:Phage capsid protein
MSANLPSLYAQQFATNVALLLQQKESRFRGAVTEGHYIGKQASPVDQIGAVSMQPVLSRFAPMGRVDAAVDRRWVLPSDFDLPQLIDQFDKLRLLTDPESSYVTNAVQAANRQMDDLIIAAAAGTAQTGETASTATTFPSSQVVSVNLGGTASNMNVDKIKRGVRLLRANENMPDDPIFCAISAIEEESLLSEIQVINEDYNANGGTGGAAPVLRDGHIERFMGVTFLHSERLLTGTDDAAGTSRSCPMWAKSGMHLGLWNDVTTDVSQRKDLQGLPWQAYVYMTAGATRVEEKKVVRIWCR